MSEEEGIENNQHTNNIDIKKFQTQLFWYMSNYRFSGRQFILLYPIQTLIIYKLHVNVYDKYQLNTIATIYYKTHFRKPCTSTCYKK